MKLFTYIIVFVSFILLGCKKEDNASPDDFNSTSGSGSFSNYTIDSMPQVIYTIDGIQKKYRKGGTVVCNSYNDGSNPRSFFSIVNSSGINCITIKKGKLAYSSSSTSPSDQSVKDFFPLSTMSMATATGSGISISLTYGGKTWSTIQGNNNLVGSFQIIDSKDEYNFGTYSIKVKAIFSCTVYDQNGNSKSISNGLFIGSFNNS